MRLAKYLAGQGVASRRKSEELIAEGRVSVNGNIIKEQGFKIDPLQDKVEVDGHMLQTADKVYLLLYKPAGYISSVSDPWGRPVVTDLIKEEKNRRIYPVGRLDLDTEGLLLMTNDGDFANIIIHPRYKMDKKYEALVQGKVTKDAIKQLQKGILLEDGMTAPAGVHVLKHSSDKTLLEVIIHEGRKRQVRRMLEAVGHPVIHLKRTEVGFLTLKGLKDGEYRYLNSQEVKKLIMISQNTPNP
ncbi:MAG TPA: pseudouridine synthase [Syntrophomonadaceae bacterium]|nr:pseudouridine synthase [Syntrophomonadaceae bacterium]HRX21574.1 pseudouridine synthase [Syntrophomonadaceae bacterium]